MSLTQKTLSFLIDTFKSSNFNLWKVLTGLNNQVVSLITTVNSDETILLNEKYTFRILGVLVEGTDVLPTWQQICLPLDSSNNVIGAFQISRLDINVKVPTSSGSLVVDLLISKDRGVTFNSILGPTAAQKIILPVGLTWIKFGRQLFTGGNILQDGWWFRVDVITTDGVASGCEMVLRGSLVI
jgi:hypothetical protein